MLTHAFLILSLLFLTPGALVYALRPDLRGVIHVMALCSLPFALTEFLFYPTYWAPEFLFGLIHVLGFGIEDILFVVGLAALATTAYPFFSGRRYATHEVSSRREQLRRVVSLLGVTFVFVALAALVDVPMIYGSFVIQLMLGAYILSRRLDLSGPALTGAVLTMGVYTGLCLVFARLIPGVFDLAWNTDQFLDVYVLGIPVEELMYGSAAGFVATAFYPYVWGKRFA